MKRLVQDFVSSFIISFIRCLHDTHDLYTSLDLCLDKQNEIKPKTTFIYGTVLKPMLCK